MPRQRSNWKLIVDGSYRGRNVFVHENFHPLYESIKKDQQANYHLTSLLRAIWSLNADASIGRPLNSAQDIRHIHLVGISVEYYIDDTDVLIGKLTYNSTFRPPIGNQGTGLYRVQYSRNEWMTDATPARKMDLGHEWDGSHYAAVAGTFKDKEAAGRMLPKHITKAYSNDILEKHTRITNKHYSLFWIKKGEHKAPASGEALASLIQHASDAAKPVNWLIHGEGAFTFKQALEALKSNPSLIPHANDLHKELALASGMAKQRVFFSNPRGVDAKSLEDLCGKVGLKFEKAKVNPRDLYSPDARRSAIKEIASMSAKVVASPGNLFAGGMSAAGIAALHSQGVKLGEFAAKAVANPTVVTIAAAAVVVPLTVVAVKDSFSKVSSGFLAMRALATTTFGRGNDFWYEDDKTLLEQASA